jgi:hypothetical protein
VEDNRAWAPADFNGAVFTLADFQKIAYAIFST